MTSAAGTPARSGAGPITGAERFEIPGTFADKRIRRANGTAESLSLQVFNPGRTAKFPGRRVSKKALRRSSGISSLGGAGLFPE